MKTFNKYYSIIAIVSAIVLVLAGCGNKKTGDITSPGGSGLFPEISVGEGDEISDSGDEGGGGEIPGDGEDGEPGDGDGEPEGGGDGEPGGGENGEPGGGEDGEPGGGDGEPGGDGDGEPGGGDGEPGDGEDPGDGESGDGDDGEPGGSDGEPGDGDEEPESETIVYVTVVFYDEYRDEVINQEVIKGETVEKPADLASTSGAGLHKGNSNVYPFTGWYTSEGEAWDFSSPITEDMALIAKWDKSNLIPLSGNLVEKAVEHVNANPNNDTGYTLFLDKDVDVSKAQVLNNKNSMLTITGMGGMRTIKPESGKAFGLFLLEDSAKFVLGENITLRGVPNNTDALVTIESRANFSMLDGSKITGNTINHKRGKEEKKDQFNEAAAVEVVDGTFTMTGGEITGNFSKKTVKEWGFPETPSAVAIRSDGAFHMSGGSITGNEGGVAEIAYMVGKKAEKASTMGVGEGLFILSGSAKIESVVLMTDERWVEKPLKIDDWKFDLVNDKKITLHLSGGYALGEILGRFDSTASPTLEFSNNMDAKYMFDFGSYYTTIQLMDHYEKIPDGFHITEYGRLKL